MLLHEWLQYRDRRIRRLDTTAEEEKETQTKDAVPAEDTPEVPLNANVAEPQQLQPVREVVEVGADALEAAPERKEPRRNATSTPRTAQELLETLQPRPDVRSRLERVLARQRRLPIEEGGAQAARPTQGRAAETREQLVARLLDPTLTLQETALLLGVCPTSVRRYTNRGILRCFRTPGNQRRFRLSDVLEFMERRDQGEV
jgi:excisionase family DNA binding protein